jgi:predicted Zn-dependent peptidase|tara:strand:- start:592 stop:894 length:303 start_codon:yes stop_codon:yes gene_type:complete
MTPPTRDLNLNYEISRLRDKLDNGEISQQEFRTKKSLVKLEEVYENWFDISSIERYYRYQKDKALNDHAKKRISLYEFGNIINEIDKRKKHHRRVGDRYD